MTGSACFGAESLLNNFHSPGIYENNLNASEFSSGVYFYTLSAGNFNISRKIVILK